LGFDGAQRLGSTPFGIWAAEEQLVIPANEAPIEGVIGKKRFPPTLWRRARKPFALAQDLPPGCMSVLIAGEAFQAS